MILAIVAELEKRREGYRQGAHNFSLSEQTRHDLIVRYNELTKVINDINKLRNGEVTL